VTAGPTILAYHAVGSCPPDRDAHNLFVSPAAFAAQMEFLSQHRNVVDLDRVVAGEMSDGRSVALTFDDGYVSVLEEAAPVLRRYGFGATVFVPTKWIGERNTWDEPSSCDLRIMDNDQLRESERLGILVESHGHAHIDMGRADETAIREDIDASIEALREAVGRSPRYLAYPFGRQSPAARAAAESAGLEAAFTIDARHEGDYAYERVQITPLDGPRLFALKTSGRYMALRRSRIVSAGYSIVRPAVRWVLGRSRP
jgi:peptidoglycan/xylan/chitin deacetylase (PgdA/CDA1 family)